MDSENRVYKWTNTSGTTSYRDTPPTAAECLASNEIEIIVIDFKGKKTVTANTCGRVLTEQQTAQRNNYADHLALQESLTCIDGAHYKHLKWEEASKNHENLKRYHSETGTYALEQMTELNRDVDSANEALREVDTYHDLVDAGTLVVGAGLLVATPLTGGASGVAGYSLLAGEAVTAAIGTGNSLARNYGKYDTASGVKDGGMAVLSAASIAAGASPWGRIGSVVGMGVTVGDIAKSESIAYGPIQSLSDVDALSSYRQQLLNYRDTLEKTPISAVEKSAGVDIPGIQRQTDRTIEAIEKHEKATRALEEANKALNDVATAADIYAESCVRINREKMLPKADNAGLDRWKKLEAQKEAK